MALTEIYAGRVREALAGAVDTRTLAEAWIAIHPPGAAKALSQALKAFLARASTAVQAALRKVLPGAWTEGYALGRASATASARAAVDGSSALAAVDWRNWEPGDVEAAYQVAGSGLRDLLASQDVNIKSIAGSRIEELGDVLAEYISSPEVHRSPDLSVPVAPVYSTDALAARLRTVLDDPGRAYMVAHTEIARAAQAAATETFRDMGVPEVRISTAGDDRVCPVCDAAEKRGAVPVGEIAVPLHPLCRCATVAASKPLAGV